MYGHERAQGSTSSSQGRENLGASNGDPYVGAGHGSGMMYAGSAHMMKPTMQAGYSRANPAYPRNAPTLGIPQSSTYQGHKPEYASLTNNSLTVPPQFPALQGVSASASGGMEGAAGSSNGHAIDSLAGAANGSSTSNGMQRARSKRPDAAEIRRVGRIHYEELFKFLRSHLAKGQRGPRTNAREKLTRLSQQQFTELSTDVYDELMRRISNSRTGQDVPHLAVREEFHPKRNQARQKLATLPRTRFKDLSSDVFFELERRFPDLREEFRPEALAMEQEREQMAVIAESADGSHQEPLSHDAQTSVDPFQNNHNPEQALRGRPDSTLSTGSRNDVSFLRASESRDEFQNNPSSDMAVAQPSMTNLVVPAKSSLVEEEIAMPITHVHEQGDEDDAESPQEFDARSSKDEEHASVRDSVGQDNAARSTMYSQASSINTGFLNGYVGPTRSGNDENSLTSPRSVGPSSPFGVQTAAAEVEKVRSDYEYKLATLQQKLTAAEDRNADLGRESARLSADARTAKEEHEGTTRSLRDDLNRLKTLHDDKDKELQDTLDRLGKVQVRHDELVDSNARQQGSATELEALRKDCAEQGELISELRNEVTNLVQELQQLSKRNDEILSEKDAHQTIVRDLNSQVATYKRKYEAAKTELRSLKATSQLFVQQLKADDDVIASESGGIADVSLTAFQSSIDELLAAARANNVGNVLTVYRSVVLSATLIMEDIGKHERDNPRISASDREDLYSGKNKISTTLNNLMIACRNHAAGGGLSPVGLVDAAASHVSAAVVDIAKSIKIRKATDEERAEFEATFTQNGTLPNGLKPLHTNVLSSAQPSSRDTFQSPNAPDVRRRNPDLALDSGRLGMPAQSDIGRPHSPNARHGSIMGRYSPVGYRPDVSSKGSNGEVSWKSPRLGVERSRNPSSSSTSSMVHTHGKPPALPLLDAAIPRVSMTNRSTSSSTSAGLSTSPAAYSSKGASPIGLSFVAPPASSVPLQRQTSGPEEIPGNHALLGRPAAPRGSSVYSNTSSPPRVPSFVGDESGEEHWGEMRNYIEVQTEAIVHCIQALLSSIREGAQGNQLHENLTQITTIVSSIIAISKDNIPRAAAAVAAASHGDEARTAQASATAAAECERILHELSDHCEKLIDMQSIGGQFDKATKSNMASASYGVAKGLKALNGLLNQSDR